MKLNHSLLKYEIVGVVGSRQSDTHLRFPVGSGSPVPSCFLYLRGCQCISLTSRTLPLCEHVCVMHMCTSVHGYSACMWVPGEGLKLGDMGSLPQLFSALHGFGFLSFFLLHF